jgi:hypothetical protein
VGLPIAKNFIEAQGEIIGAFSEAGKGWVFIFNLSLVPRVEG